MYFLLLIYLPKIQNQKYNNVILLCEYCETTCKRIGRDWVEDIYHIILDS